MTIHKLVFKGDYGNSYEEKHLITAELKHWQIEVVENKCSTPFNILYVHFYYCVNKLIDLMWFYSLIPVVNSNFWKH